MKKKKVPNKDRAIVDGVIATYLRSRSIVARYTSGQTLLGHLPQGRESML